MNINKKVIENFLNKPFVLGQYDCIQLIGQFYNLPDEFKGINWKNKEYIDLWKNNKDKALKILKEFIEDNFYIVDYITFYDLIWIENKYLIIYGIYVGNKKLLTVTEKDGCILMNFNPDYENENKNYIIYRLGKDG